MKTIYRKRITKIRIGISNGPCFVGFHYGLRSFYIGKARTRIDNGHLAGIKDDKGRVIITTC